MSTEYPSFRVYRGLQKPIEFMMLKGRYVTVGFGIIFSSIIGFLAGFLLSGFLAAALLTLGILIPGSIWIYKNQKKGLHSKKISSGIYIVGSIIKMK